jgi:hypothetical protein
MSSIVTISAGSGVQEYASTSGSLNGVRLIWIYDEVRADPIMLSFIAPKNVAKAILARALQMKNRKNRESLAAIFLRDQQYIGKLRLLPEKHYRSFTRRLETGLYEARLVSLDATRIAGRTECYVLTSGRVPTVMDVVQARQWAQFLQWKRQPSPDYQPPHFCLDLWRLYEFVKERITIGFYPQWMPFVFSKLADQMVWSAQDGQYAKPVRYIPGDIDQMYAEATANVYEYRSAYYLDFSAMDVWLETIAANPNRADGIVFGNNTRKEV